jgi:hypothetical protein
MKLITTIIEPDADGTVSERRMAGSAEDLKGFGCLRGKISLSPDFDEPLEDFKDYMA